MPVYDYLCRKCGQVTEVIHGIVAPGPRFCPACGAEGMLRKAFAPPTVHFKGSGWAKKDRSTSSRRRSRTDGDAASGDGADSSGTAADGESPAKGAAANDAKAGSGDSDSGSTSSKSAASKSDAGSGKGAPKATGKSED